MKWTQKISNDTIFEHVNRNETSLHKAIGRKMGLFGHIARMRDNKIKTLVFDYSE